MVGETPNLAARLQALAEPGTVVIAEATRRLLGGLFELDGPRRRSAQGLRRAGAGLAGRRRRSRPRAASRRCTGAASRRWSAASRSWRCCSSAGEQAKDGEGQVVLLSGEPGIGKSRLLRALRERLADEPHTAAQPLLLALPHRQRAPPGDRACSSGRRGFDRDDTAGGASSTSSRRCSRRATDRRGRGRAAARRAARRPDRRRATRRST